MVSAGGRNESRRLGVGQRGEDPRAPTETLQLRLEALAKERPTEERELLDANCDKLSKLAEVLKEFC